MSHVVKVDSLQWLNTLSWRNNPVRVVSLCFFVVLVFSTLLAWREVVVLEEAYISSQRNSLENVANKMDAQLQANLDGLKFYRNGMQAALQTPLAFSGLRGAAEAFMQRRQQPQWSVALDNRRTLPVYGVSDDFIAQSALLSRDNPRLSNELTATLEVGYLLRLSTSVRRVAQRVLYVSRAGFFLTNPSITDPKDTIEQYYALVTSPWFTSQTQRNNPGRGFRWQPHAPDSNVQSVAVSLPVDYDHYWYGVLAMEFSLPQIKRYLVVASEGEEEGEYRLYDRRMNQITSLLTDGVIATSLTDPDKAQIAHAFEHDTRGGLRLDTRYISWQKLQNFDGVLIRVHHLQEGLRGEYGSISMALGVLWILFTSMLILAWVVIHRMVNNMTALQKSLQWQAWYDGLTRLFNRGTLFERANTAMKSCREQQKPIAVIQMDLDCFKSINDRFGHQAGDRVLAHTAGLISSRIGSADLAGRVGGEEFCIVLPGATKEAACLTAERIRERINSRELLLGKGVMLRISASFGVSGSDESGQYDVEFLQSVADKRLYQAKQDGRNRVCCSEPPPAE
ncbi:cellulose biosynthesis regulator diguanylate cyclase DgcQ [[Enterobacter] lignolyticus]|uniref:diguanylate cyclase n=1 Tax=Enterobacter lignolyticus (strain SCF1) TaxID=701347 RepID=E3G208_ENTLS|nr:cellulose biosynthesis regulator diguanylate cyclase DgcQ [[Enterobacter] lignolyticus]ADO48051.1 diguanylate cyclase [[Enterobacter] lignolyticus SCF1]